MPGLPSFLNHLLEKSAQNHERSETDTESVYRLVARDPYNPKNSDDSENVTSPLMIGLFALLGIMLVVFIYFLSRFLTGKSMEEKKNYPGPRGRRSSRYNTNENTQEGGEKRRPSLGATQTAKQTKDMSRRASVTSLGLGVVKSSALNQEISEDKSEATLDQLPID
jgi:hypothetical protein